MAAMTVKSATRVAQGGGEGNESCSSRVNKYSVYCMCIKCFFFFFIFIYL